VSGPVTFSSWFLWLYGGTFLLLTVLNAWWLFDVVRRPAECFPVSWPQPKLRWGAVPVAWLAVVTGQTVIYFGGLALRQGPAAQNLVDRTNLGLLTFALISVVIVFGLAYLLRVVFPKGGRPEPAAEEPAGDEAEAAGEGADGGTQADGGPEDQNQR
jgi:hypothetical protein